MNTKTILGTIAGGVAFFLSGWLIYGIILENLMKNEDPNGFMRPDGNYIWWALIAGNFVWGFFLTWIMQSRNETGWQKGMMTGLVVGVCTGLAFDLGMYAMSNLFSEFGPVFIDVIANTLLYVIAGAVIGLVLGSNQKEANAS